MSNGIVRVKATFVKSSFNPLPINVLHHIETSRLICSANQLTGFYIMRKIGRLWVKEYTLKKSTILISSASLR